MQAVKSNVRFVTEEAASAAASAAWTELFGADSVRTLAEALIQDGTQASTRSKPLLSALLPSSKL